jgi:GTP-binding protein
VPFERGGRRFELIDTAGLRRKGKVFEAIEKFSVVKTLQAISDANVVLLLDATQGVSDQDAHIAGYAAGGGAGGGGGHQQVGCRGQLPARTLQRSIEQRLAFLKFARCCTSRHEAPGSGAAVEGHRRRRTQGLGQAQDVHAGA